MLADAQTAGGLIITVPEKESLKLIKSLNKNTKFKSKVIGSFTEKCDKNIFVK